LTVWLLASPGFAGEIHDLVSSSHPDDIAKAKALLKANPELRHAVDTYPVQMPLHIVARQGPIEMVQFLLDLKAEVNAIAYDGFTPMHLVEDPKIARLLIKAGANLDDVDWWGNTPLQQASLLNRIDIAEEILASGYKCDLSSAVRLGKRELAMQMVKADPQVLQKVKGGSTLWGGNTPLAIAAGQGDIELVKFFLDAGADVNQGTVKINSGRMPATALSNAVWADNAEMVEFLLKRGASTDGAGGKFYNSIVHYAIENSSQKIIELLLEYTSGGPPKPRAAKQDSRPFTSAVVAGVTMLLLAGLLGLRSLWAGLRTKASRHPETPGNCHNQGRKDQRIRDGVPLGDQSRLHCQRRPGGPARARH
jgi:ankyrin repeat protein